MAEREPTIEEMLATQHADTRQIWNSDLSLKQREQLLEAIKADYQRKQKPPEPERTADIPLSLEDSTVEPKDLSLEIGDSTNPMRDTPEEKAIANEDTVRDTGYTDRQVRETLERRYTPLLSVQPSRFTQPSTMWVIWSFLRKFVALGGVVLLGACWTMIQIDEYALALALLVVGMTAFALQVYDWKGIEGSPIPTRILKIVAAVLIAACLIFFMAVIIGRRDSKAWSILLPTTGAPALVPTPSPTPTPLATISPAKSTSEQSPRDIPQALLKGIAVKGGFIYRLDTIMRSAGYHRPTKMSVLWVRSNETNTAETIIVGTRRDLDEKTGEVLYGGDSIPFPGEDITNVYVRADKDCKVDITFKPK